MEYVFMCNFAKNRSPTAVEVALEIAERKGLKIKARAMALYPEESAEYEELEAEKLKMADGVFVMTEEMRKLVNLKYRISLEKIQVLHIKDEYDCHGLAGPKMKAMLREVLFGKLEKIIC